MKNQPLRMCVACREKMEKSSMLRVVRTPEGEIKLDFTGKANGRGAYICDKEDCLIKLTRKKLLSKVFSAPVEDAVYEGLSEAYVKGKRNYDTRE